MIRALRLGYQNVAFILLEDPRVDPSDRDNEAVIIAAGNGQEILAIILQDPRVDPSAQNYEALFAAIFYHKLLSVTILLMHPLVDPSFNENMPVIAAAGKNFDILRMLVANPRVDPSARHNWAIAEAAQTRALDNVALLARDPRVRRSLPAPNPSAGRGTVAKALYELKTLPKKRSNRRQRLMT